DYDYDYDYDYSDKNEELSKNIETRVEIAKDGTFIVFAKNNNKKTVEIEIDVEFFDASGKSIDDDYVISLGLGANSELADEIYAPETYNTYKITVDAEEASDDSLYDKVSYTHKQTNNNVIVTVKNNADKTIEDIDMTIVFYDGDKALSMDYDYIYDLGAGQTKDITFYAPYDYDTHQYFKYTSYKVYLNDAYNW
ncbi:MAG: hypothetical protein IJN90_02895, partial [Bacilli bacterium]|nr:hypothetical protein [Bacilli bacterium]